MRRSDQAADLPSIVGEAWNAPDRHLAPMLGTFGYTMPALAELEWTPVSAPFSRGNLAVQVSEGASNNWLVAPKEHRWPSGFAVHFHKNARNNVLVLGSRSNVHGHFYFHGSGGLLVLGAGVWQTSYLNVRLWSNDHLFFWGEKSTSNGVSAVLQGDRSRIVVGDDCMFANDIFIRNTDMHAVVDMRNGDWLNAGGNVHFEPHVWVAQEALILKRAVVGFGAVVGAKAIVNREVPRYAMVAGAPAKVVRRDVSWDRDMRPNTDTVAKLRDYERRLGQPAAPP